MAEAPSPCKHTIFVAHSEGIEYLDERAKKQLLEKGYVIDGGELLEVRHANNEEENLYPDELCAALEFSDGIVIEAHVGAPSGMTSYVGFAALDGE